MLLCTNREVILEPAKTKVKHFFVRRSKMLASPDAGPAFRML
jgi:hypothetical protein